MPDFLREAFHRRATEILNQGQKIPPDRLEGIHDDSTDRFGAGAHGGMPGSASTGPRGFAPPGPSWHHRAGQHQGTFPEHDPLWQAENWIKVQRLFGHRPTEDDMLRVEFWQSRRGSAACSARDLFMTPEEHEQEYAKWREARWREEAAWNPRIVSGQANGGRKGITAFLEACTITPWINAVAMAGRLLGHPFPRLEERVNRTGQRMNHWTKELSLKINRVLKKMGRCHGRIPAADARRP